MANWTRCETFIFREALYQRLALGDVGLGFGGGIGQRRLIDRRTHQDFMKTLCCVFGERWIFEERSCKRAGVGYAVEIFDQLLSEEAGSVGAMPMNLAAGQFLLPIIASAMPGLSASLREA